MSANQQAHSQTRAHDTHAARRKALWGGLKKGFWTVVITSLIVLAILGRVFKNSESPWPWVIGVAVIGTALTCIGAVRWHAAHSDDEGHYTLQKVPSMPLHLLRDHDDAWIEGRVRCPQPLRPPNARQHCSWFHLVEEELRGSGKHEHWVTTREEMHGTSIWITDGTREIEVDLREAAIDYPEVKKRTHGRTRTSLRYVSASGRISACGLARYRDEVIGPERADERDAALKAWREEHEAAIERQDDDLEAEDKEERFAAIGRSIRANKPGRSTKSPPPNDVWHLRSLNSAHGVAKGNRLMLTPHGKAPLVVTPQPRHEWHDRSEADELMTRTEADIVLGLGIPAIVWATGALLTVWEIAFWPGAVIGIAVMSSIVWPSRIVRLYNRFVIYRQRIKAGRADIDADLEVRSMLLPQLQAVVLAYSKHEKKVQTRLAELRQKADTTDTVVALRESHPKLAAQENFAALADDMTALEEKLAFGRAQVHDAIAEYNTLVQRFPASLLAKLTGFRRESQAPW